MSTDAESELKLERPTHKYWNLCDRLVTISFLMSACWEDVFSHYNYANGNHDHNFQVHDAPTVTNPLGTVCIYGQTMEILPRQFSVMYDDGSTNSTRPTVYPDACNGVSPNTTPVQQSTLFKALSGEYGV